MASTSPLKLPPGGFAVEGLYELRKKLNSLGDKKMIQIERKAVTKAARPVRKSVKALVPTRYGHLKKSIGVKIVTKPRKKVCLAIIGAKNDYKVTIGQRKKDGGPKKPAGSDIVYRPARIIGLVDKGTSRSRGARFMDRAVLQTKDQVAAILVSTMAEEVHKAMNAP
jgi:HK97 gp10 family phage protein